MPWSALDDVLFSAHLQSVLAHIDAALAQAGYDSLVIHAGNERMAFQDDQAYPFRINPWFAWLVPAPPAPGSLIRIRPGETPELLFVAPDDYWHSPPSVPDAAWTSLFTVSAHATNAAALSAAQRLPGRTAWFGESSPPLAAWDANPPRLLALLEQPRCRKTPYELACMREATRLGVLGHLAAERAFRSGASELDIHLAYLGAVRQTDAQLPYPNIIGLNEHAATLHYQLRDTQPPRRVQSLLIDAGATCRGYASDITRTWSMSPGLFGTLIDGMHDLQQELCEAVAPGVDWRALHLTAHRLVAQLLREAGVLRMAAEDAVASGVSSAFLPHGLGHLLGLQVHDIGGFRPDPDAEPIPRPEGHPSLRLTRRLEAGMVVTVEPGLYFIDSLLARLHAGPHAQAVNWTLVQTLRTCGGIRIEDNVAVTASGHDNLTRTAFADVG
ncbi:MAG: Xaa-Pro dipeptidase [Steroidobacteraceae bacterium]